MKRTTGLVSTNTAPNRCTSTDLAQRSNVTTAGDIAFHPVTPERLDDLTRFAAAHGKFGYCACMRWRLTSTEFGRSDKASRGLRLEQMVRDSTPVGVLAYSDGEPVGWCSVAPRTTYAGLARYRAIPRVDDAPVWSVVCFYIAPSVRRRGLTVGLLTAAVTYATAQGAQIVEGYPVDPGARLYTYMGSPAAFLAAGFRDVTPTGSARTVMRYYATPAPQL